MDITLEKKNPTEASIKITLTEADYQPKVREKLKEYSKKAQIKGFRPGKVPPALIQKMYGKSIMIDEINHILSHAVNDYIRDNKIKILGDPLPNTENADKIDWENQKDFEFQYEIGLVDDFKYTLEGKKLIRYNIKVDDKSVEDTIADLQKQYGKMTNPEKSEDGDFLYGQVVQNGGEFNDKVSIPLNLIEKKERKNFIGLSKGDKVTFDVKKAFKDAATIADALNIDGAAAEALEGEFELEVINVNRQEAAELDQEFFDKIFGSEVVKSEEEFRNKVKETISENYKRETEIYFDRTIQDALLESTEITLPDEFLKRWLLTTNEGKITEEDIAKEYDAYAKEMKWTLIQNKIGEDHEIKVENSDIEEKAKQIISDQLGSSGLLAQLGDNLDAFVQNYLQSNNGDNYMRVFSQVKAEKVFEIVREKAEIEEKEVDVEEFKDIVTKK